MASRNVSVVEEDTKVEHPFLAGRTTVKADTTPVVEDAFLITQKSTTVVDADDFEKPVTEIKTLEGFSANFKKSMTRDVNNTLSKARTGIGGAKSKQIEEPDFSNGYNTFDVVEPPYNLDYLARLYELSPIHYAAVNAKVNNIVGLGFKLVENAKSKRNFESLAENEKKTKKVRAELEKHRDEITNFLDEVNSEKTFVEILVNVWRDYEVMGNGYIEISRKKDGSIGYIGHIPAQTLRIRKKRDGFVQMTGFEVQFFANFGAGVDDDGNRQTITNPIGNGTPNEVIHISKYSPTSGYYGIPDIVAAKQAIAGNEFAARFNLDYFENKAIPRHVIILKGAKVGSGLQQKMLSFFETGLKGENHRSIFIPLPPGDKENPVELKFEKIEAGTQDSSFANYRTSNNNDILMVHGVPITKVSVSDAASLAIAKDADKTFKEQVCSPQQRVFEKKLNQLIKEKSDALEFKLTEMTLTDADTQSQIDDRMVKAGIWLANEVRTRDGMPAIDGGDERVDLNAADKIAQAKAEETTTRQRDAARTAGATDSRGAARSPKGEGRTTS